RYRRLRAVTVLGQELQQHPVAGRVIADPPFGEQFAGLVDQRNVVMPLGPVDPAEHSHTFSHHRAFMQLTSSCGSRGALIPGLGRSAISVAVRDTSAPQGPLSAPELAEVDRRSPCGGLAPQRQRTTYDGEFHGTWRRRAAPLSREASKTREIPRRLPGARR